MMRHKGIVSLVVAFSFAVLWSTAVKAEPLKWYKGNTHTHTWWSDGDSPPETVVKWYKDHGYHFLALSDHNALSEGTRWLRADGGARAKAATTYEETFDKQWIEKRERDGKIEYRLKPLNEFRALFEEAGKFMLIQAEEISDKYKEAQIHVNGVNLKEVIPPPHGDSIQETLQNNIDAVLEQRRRTGQPMFPHVNHPNYKWSLGPEHLMHLKGEQFFEVFNGHPVVYNAGDAEHASTDRMWDIILAKRLGDLNLPVMYGLATDDAHTYTTWGEKVANPGRGWVMVRATHLTPENIVLAMERGDFYASTGVVLKDVRFEKNRLTIEIDAKPGVTYYTHFIGTKKNYKREVADRHQDPESILQPKYSKEIGLEFAMMTGATTSYGLAGDELYVRAKITSSSPHPNPIEGFGHESAWIQPVIPE